MNQMFKPIFLLLLSLLLVACGGGQSSQEHLEAGRLLIEQEEFEEAITELKNSLSKDVHNAEARVLLGKAYFETRDFEGAEKELFRALESTATVDRSTVIPLLARTLMELGDYAQIDALDVRGLDPQSRSMTLAAKSLARLFQGDDLVAEDMLETARDIENPPLYTQVAAVRFLMAREKYSKATKALDAIIEEHPEYLPAWNLRGDIYAARKNPKMAERAYSQVLKIFHRAFDARLNRAMMRIYLGNFKGAREDLQKLNKMHGRAAGAHPGVSFAEGITQLQRGQYDRARKAFEKTADLSYAYPLSYYYMAVIDLQQGLLERALGEVYRFLTLAPESIAGPKLAARLELEHGGYHEAEQLLEPIVELYPQDVEALNLLASAKLGLHKGGEGVALLARVTELRPKSPDAQARLGAGYLATGELRLGVKALERSVRRDPLFEQADILLILNYLAENKVDQAIEAARDYRGRHPGSTTSFNLLGRAYFAKGAYPQADWAYNRALELDATDSAARHGLAEIALKKGKYEEARSYYHQVLRYNEDDLQTQLKLAASYSLEGNPGIMRNMLEIATDDHPESTEPLLILIRYYMAADKLDEAGPLVDRLLVIERGQPDALATLSAYMLATGSHNQALITLERLLTIRPDVSQYHYMQAKAYSGLGDQENALLELARTLELEPDHFYANIAMARLTLQIGRDDLFEQHMEKLQTLALGNLDVMRLELAAALRKGDEERVEQLLVGLYVQWPSTENTIAVAEHHLSKRDGREAVAVLKNWLAENPKDIEASLKLAQVYEDLSKPDNAIETYEAILKADHDNIVALNNYAWVLLDQDAKKALRFAQKAHDLSPESTAVLDTLAMAQLANGKPAEARRTLQRALEKSPDDPELKFHEARILFAEGEHQGAVRALNLVLAQHSEFSTRREAEALLKKLQ